jgi:hypothetical protein
MEAEQVRIPKAFISHKSNDSEFAKKLATSLRERGIYAWLDIWNMPPGKPLSDAMQSGIEECDVMVLILTPESMQSVHAGIGGVAFEVHIGEGRKYYDKAYRIIGVLLKACDPPEKLKNRIGRWLDFRNDYEFTDKVIELAEWIKNPASDLGPPVNIHDGKISTGLVFRKLVRVSPDGKLLATSSPDGSIAFFDNRTKEPLLRLSHHKEPVHDMAFSPDGKSFYSTDSVGTVEWDLKSGAANVRLVS